MTNADSNTRTKKCNIVIFVLARIAKHKLVEHFNKLRAHTQLSLVK